MVGMMCTTTYVGHMDALLTGAQFDLKSGVWAWNSAPYPMGGMPRCSGSHAQLRYALLQTRCGREPAAL